MSFARTLGKFIGTNAARTVHYAPMGPKALVVGVVYASQATTHAARECADGIHDAYMQKQNEYAHAPIEGEAHTVEGVLA